MVVEVTCVMCNSWTVISDDCCRSCGKQICQECKKYLHTNNCFIPICQYCVDKFAQQEKNSNYQHTNNLE